MYEPTTRMKRVADLIRSELANIIKTSTGDARLRLVSLTDVRVSPDLKHAKVFFVTLDETPPEDIKSMLKAFSKASGYFRCLLAENTVMRRVPQLHFAYDESTVKGGRLSDLINQVAVDDEQLGNKKL